jgi:hypothetical protein
LPSLALLGEGGRAAPIREKTSIALATEPALGREPSVSGALQVNEKLAVHGKDHGAKGNGDIDIFSAFAVLAFRGAVLAVSGAAKRVILKAQQRGLIVISHKPDIAAITAVATIGPAFGHVRFTAKTDASRPAITGFGVQLSAIDEGRHHFILRG